MIARPLRMHPLLVSLQNRIICAPSSSFPSQCLRHASSHHAGPKESEKTDHLGHHGHKPDPEGKWYEYPQSNEVYRHSRLRLPWYIGKAPVSAYRAPPANDSTLTRVQAILLGTMLYWWCMWGIMSEPGHIVGEWFYPDRHKWTNEELGVPPLDFEQ